MMIFPEILTVLAASIMAVFVPKDQAFLMR